MPGPEEDVQEETREYRQQSGKLRISTKIVNSKQFRSKYSSSQPFHLHTVTHLSQFVRKQNKSNLSNPR